ncbi:MAG TPA: family 10 glycosylhydrolase, partial [Gemmatimonadaceae bacterium]
MITRSIFWFGAALAVSSPIPSSIDAPTTTRRPMQISRLEHPSPEDLPPAVEREFRGAWVSPLDDMTGPDWPSRPGMSPDDQRAELRILLDHAKAIGLNAIVLHVRMAGDALYPSHLVPWSTFLSGKSGEAPRPEYDPLAFAIAEAHARGLQLHAWFNPFRAMMPRSTAKMAANHVTRAHKSWIRKYGSQTWIDPGEPAARAAVLAEIFDVVDRYDIDAVHLDDYFYPYREARTTIIRVNGRRVRSRQPIPFPDATTWEKYGQARYHSREDWRRANVDSFVSQLYKGVKQRKPWVLVGISPFGIWRSGEPPSVTGLSAYSELFADARLWLRQGWVDYLAPQLYWPIAGPEGRFTALDDWWRSQNEKNRAV